MSFLNYILIKFDKNAQKLPFWTGILQIAAPEGPIV